MGYWNGGRHYHLPQWDGTLARRHQMEHRRAVTRGDKNWNGVLFAQ